MPRKAIDATNVELGLTRLSQHFQYFSLAIDERTDVKQYGPTFGFLRGIYEDINITDEMFDLLRIKDVTSGEVIFQELEILMARFNLYFKRHGL